MSYPAPAYRGGEASGRSGYQSYGRAAPAGRPSRSPARQPLKPYKPPRPLPLPYRPTISAAARFVLPRVYAPFALGLLAYDLWAYFGRHHGFSNNNGPCLSWPEINDATSNGIGTICFMWPIMPIPNNALNYTLGERSIPYPDFLWANRVYNRNPGYTGKPYPNAGESVLAEPANAPESLQAQEHVPLPEYIPPPFVQPLLPEGLPIFQPWPMPLPLPRWVVPELPKFDPFGDPIRGPNPTPLRDPARFPRYVPEGDPMRDPQADPLPRTRPGRLPRIEPIPTIPGLPHISPVRPLRIPDTVIPPNGGPPYHRPNSHQREKPKGPKRQKKPKMALEIAAVIARKLGQLSEVSDFIDAVWDALPEEAKTKNKGERTTPLQKAGDLFSHLGDVDWDKAIENIVKNEILDRLQGKLGEGLKKYQQDNGTYGKTIPDFPIPR